MCTGKQNTGYFLGTERERDFTARHLRTGFLSGGNDLKFADMDFHGESQRRNDSRGAVPFAALVDDLKND